MCVCVHVFVMICMNFQFFVGLSVISKDLRFIFIKCFSTSVFFWFFFVFFLSSNSFLPLSSFTRFQTIRNNPSSNIYHSICPVGWGWLHHCRGVRLPPNECPGYDTKHSDGEVPVILGFWGIRITPSLPLLPCPLWPSVVAPDRALFMG